MKKTVADLQHDLTEYAYIIEMALANKTSLINKTLINLQKDLLDAAEILESIYLFHKYLEKDEAIRKLFIEDKKWT